MTITWKLVVMEGLPLDTRKCFCEAQVDNEFSVAGITEKGDGEVKILVVPLKGDPIISKVTLLVNGLQIGVRELEPILLQSGIDISFSIFEEQ